VAHGHGSSIAGAEPRRSMAVESSSGNRHSVATLLGQDLHFVDWETHVKCFVSIFDVPARAQHRVGGRSRNWISTPPRMPHSHSHLLGRSGQPHEPAPRSTRARYSNPLLQLPTFLARFARAICLLVKQLALQRLFSPVFRHSLIAVPSPHTNKAQTHSNART
jgi:hypothetical protein